MRTRTAATALAAAGHVRLNGERVTAASRLVRPGDVVTVALDRIVRIMKVVGFAERRGSAEAATTLYEDLTAPQVAPTGAGPQASSGGARPTKRDRRSFDRLKPGWKD